VRSLIGGLTEARRRPPAQIRDSTPVPYSPTRGGINWGGPGDNGGPSEAELRSMGAVGTLFSIVNRTSNATAQVDWRLYRKPTATRRSTATGDEAQRTEVLNHAALDLWNKPNPFMARQELVEVAQQHLDLTGECWLLVARNPRSKLPLELWPVRPDRMAPVPHPTEYISGYVYTGPDGQKIPLQRDEVLFARMPNPLDPYRGLSPVAAAMIDLRGSRDAAEWNASFFRNSAEPGGVIEYDHTLDDAEFNQLTARWREQHQGVNNAHRVAVIEAGGKWVDRKYTQRDMQFAELRSMSREIIREAFGIHAHMLGLSEDVNKANAQMAEISFARWLIYPRAQRIKALLNTQLLPLYGATDLEFDHERTVPEDREADDRERVSKAQAAQLLTSVGYEPAGVLTAVGLPPIPHTRDADGGGATPKELADMIQSIYLGVDVVTTWPEARAILNRAGAGLDPNAAKPEPAQHALPGSATTPAPDAQ
jgi:HK97 family phage portal protein